LKPKEPGPQPNRQPDPAELAAVVDLLQDMATLAEAAMRLGLARPLPADAKESAHDLVTPVDRGLESEMRAMVAARFPSHRFLGEEGGETGGGAGGTWTWIVDPVDGTTNYANGLPVACSSIAALQAGRTVAAAIVDPFRSERFMAVRGQGATRNGVPMHVKRRPAGGIGGGLVLCELAGGHPWPGLVELAVFADRLGATMRVLGSGALATAQVAAGRADAIVHVGPHAWDIAAACLLVEEAGGEVTGWSGAEGYDLFSGGPMIAGAPAACAVLRERLAELEGGLAEGR
jgi:myo-inositol-1(or 4)-monophosphatase